MKRIPSRQYTKSSAQGRQIEDGDRYELDEVNISVGRDNYPQELKLHKITTYAFKIQNLPKSPGTSSVPLFTPKQKLPPISPSMSIYDFNLFKPKDSLPKIHHPAKHLSLSSPVSQKTLSIDFKNSPKLNVDISIDVDEAYQLPSPKTSKKHEATVNLFIGKKDAPAMEATYREDKPLGFKTIHSTHNGNHMKLVSTLQKRKENLEGYIMGKVYKYADTNVTKFSLNECMKPVMPSSTKRFIKNLGKNFKVVEKSPKKRSGPRETTMSSSVNPTVSQVFTQDSNEIYLSSLMLFVISLFVGLILGFLFANVNWRWFFTELLSVHKIQNIGLVILFFGALFAIFYFVVYMPTKSIIDNEEIIPKPPKTVNKPVSLSTELKRRGSWPVAYSNKFAYNYLKPN